MDVLTYLANELPNKKSPHVAKQLDYLDLEPGDSVKKSKKIIIQYYLDKHLEEVLLYYQMGKKVVNPENRQGLTTLVNKLSGVWELLDINNKVIPATETKPFDELVTKYSKVTVK